MLSANLSKHAISYLSTSSVQDDGGLLFGLALTVFAASAALLLIHRDELPIIGSAS